MAYAHHRARAAAHESVNPNRAARHARAAERHACALGFGTPWSMAGIGAVAAGAAVGAVGVGIVGRAVYRGYRGYVARAERERAERESAAQRAAQEARKKREEHNARREKERQAADARYKEKSEALKKLKADSRSVLYNVYLKLYPNGSEQDAINYLLSKGIPYKETFAGITFALESKSVQSNRLANRDQQDAHRVGNYELDPGVAVVVQRGNHREYLAERALNSTVSRWL